MSRHSSHTESVATDIDALFRANQTAVPADLDARILNAASEALSHDQPQRPKAPSSRLPQWFGLAASVALAVVLVPLMLQSPESSLNDTQANLADSVTASEAVPSPAMEPEQDVSARREAAPNLTPETELKNKAHQRAMPTPSADYLPQASGGSASADPDALSAESDSTLALPPETAFEVPTPADRSQLPQETATARSSPVPQPQAESDNASLGHSLILQFSDLRASTEAVANADADADADAIDSQESASNEEAADKTFAYRRSPDTWISKIESLIAQGLLKQAREEYAEFRATHPQYITDLALPEK